MAVTDKWIGGSADWGASAANWSAGLPTSKDDVVISTATVVTVTFSGGDDYTVNSLTVGDDGFDMTGGSLAITTTASFADGFTQTGGVLTAGGAVTVDGTGALTGGSSEGRTAFVFDGTVALAGYLLGGSTSLKNAKTTNLTGLITLGDNTGVHATIDNEKGGTFAIAGDFGIVEGAATASFINAGTFSKIGGTGTSVIAVDFIDTGNIVVDAGGTIEFGGPSNSFAGAISGPGQVILGDASQDLIAAGTKISTATFTITNGGTVVTLDENLALGHTFNLVGGALFEFGRDGLTLSLSGTNSFVDNVALATAASAGTLVTAAGSTSTVSSLTFGGNLTWDNFGTVGETDTLQLGDSTFNPAAFVNEKGGVYEFAADVGIQPGAAANSSFTNDAGAVLEKTGGNGPNGSVVGVDMTDSGTIIVETGIIEFTGATNRFAGRIAGAGEFMIGGGSSTIASGAAISTRTFELYGGGTAVSFGENVSYAGAFNVVGANLDLDGFTLTLSGTGTLDGNAFTYGTGTIVTVKGSTLAVGGFTLGGSDGWQNSGTIDESNTLTIGDQGFNVAHFVNERGGVYDFVADAGVALGSSTSSTFVNSAGALLEKTGGTGDSVVAIDFTNNGAVRVASGEIEFATLVDGSGSFTIEPGAILQFDASVAKGSTVEFATKTGGELVLFDSQGFDAAIKGFGGTGTDKIDLRDINFDSTSFSMSYNAKKGILTLTDGTHTASLDFIGSYTLRDFHASADGLGGTLLVDPNPHPLLAFNH